MVFQTNFEFAFADVALRQVQRAGTQRNGLLDKIQEVAHFADGGVRTKILRPIFQLLPC